MGGVGARHPSKAGPRARLANREPPLGSGRAEVAPEWPVRAGARAGLGVALDVSLGGAFSGRAYLPRYRKLTTEVVSVLWNQRFPALLNKCITAGHSLLSALDNQALRVLGGSRRSPPGLSGRPPAFAPCTARAPPATPRALRSVPAGPSAPSRVQGPHGHARTPGSAGHAGPREGHTPEGPQSAGPRRRSRPPSLPLPSAALARPLGSGSARAHADAGPLVGGLRADGRPRPGRRLQAQRPGSRRAAGGRARRVPPGWRGRGVGVGVQPCARRPRPAPPRPIAAAAAGPASGGRPGPGRAAPPPHRAGPVPRSEPPSACAPARPRQVPPPGRLPPPLRPRSRSPARHRRRHVVAPAAGAGDARGRARGLQPPPPPGGVWTLDHVPRLTLSLSLQLSPAAVLATPLFREVAESVQQQSADGHLETTGPVNSEVPFSSDNLQHQHPAMGDMKTPDFDDLLAAFDIPDPTSLDAKEAIQTPSEENESSLKPPGMCIDESVSLSHSGSAPDVPAVSVIVKNTSRQESFEAEKDHIAPSLLHNGFRGSDLPGDPHNCGKFDSTFMNGDSARSFSGKLEPPKSEPLPTFNQFSPISSPEPDDPIKDNGFGIKPKHSDSYFPPPSGCGPVGGPVLEALAKFPVPELHMFDHLCKKEPKPEPLPLGSQQERERSGQKAGETHKELDAHRFFGEALEFNSHPSNSVGEPKGLAPALGARSSVPPRQRLKPAHSKLSSCVAALVALQAKRVASVSKEDPLGHTKDPSGPTKEGSKGSPKMPKSPKSPRSPLEAARKSMKPSDSPRSVCSDSSSKGSPSVAASSPPAIPKVRIKTIKTSSGEIKRTVTRILPDPDDPSKSPVGSPLGSATTEAPTEVPGDEVTAVPTEEHFPELGAHSGSPQGDRRGDECATKASDSSSPCSSSGPRVLKGATLGSQTGKQPQSSTLQVSALAPANLLPKAVHLANLNLVPHSVAASVTAKSSAQRRSQPQPTQMSVPLVHQVKKAAPLIVEVFNKVLHSSNPVPLYAPNLSPPADSRIHVPASGYCCLECGDAFALEKSLSQHYGRRSVHIEVLCTLCSKTLLFFNKCSLLRHARDHKSKGLVMQCSQLLVKPISADQMFPPVPVAPVAPAAPTAPAAPAPPPSPKRGLTSGSASPPPPALPLYPDPVRLIRYGIKCPECHKQIRDFMVLAAHFQRTTEDTEGLTCPVCQMLLPNQCSFCAHQRIHTHKSPYCCPECGVLCRSAYFQTHVKENCLHYARKVGYRCIHCGVVHVTLALLKSHIQERHCQVFHKCAFCPMAFKTASSTADHSATQHPAQPHRPSQLIYKCSCEMVFNKKRHIQQHFSQNVGKTQVGVFKCPECPLLFVQKPELMQHVKSTHGVPRNVDELSSLQSSADTSSSRPGSRAPPEPPATRVTARGSSLPSGRWGRPEAHRRAEARPRLRNTGWTCQECQEWVPDRESYVSHMKKSHSRTLKRYPCRQCEQSFHTPNSLRKHIRNNHDTVKKVYTCGYCTEDSPSFPRPSLLESHISLMHGIRNPDLSQSSKVRPPGGHSPQVNHLKRPISGVGDTPGTSNGVAVSSTKRHKSLFQCAKCSFATDSGLEFQSHIPQHQADSSTAQCLLCGLCYTSASSLSRHLFIVHKVKDQEEEEAAAEEAEPEEGSGEEASMETRENGLGECAREPLPADPQARRSLGLAPKEDGAHGAQSRPQASQDQDSHALSPQV